MKDQSVEIKTIKLNLGGKEVELTIEQARKLKASLDELFGKVIVETVHWPSPPTWIWTSPPVTVPWYGQGTAYPTWIADGTSSITYDTNTSALCLSL